MSELNLITALFPSVAKYHKMEREINKRDKQYKQKWNNQHRNPKVEKHQFKIGDRVLLKKKKQNKSGWVVTWFLLGYTVLKNGGLLSTPMF